MMMDDKLDKEENKGVDSSRRAFIKTALIGGITVVSAAVITKKMASLTTNNNLQNAYMNDELQQDKLMKGKEYILMTKEEKEQMVRKFEEEYKHTV